MIDQNKLIAELLFPNVTKTPDYYENFYKQRNLPEGAEVTRFAPSPTGYLHIGSFFTAMIGRRTASNTNGVFFLRIEDTDQKREIKGAASVVIEMLNKFGVSPDEGPLGVNQQDVGAYGPYIQSLRKEIYQTYAKWLVAEGKAYPCFCTAEQLEQIREKQRVYKKPTGYYGEHAVCRNLGYKDIKEKIEAGATFVIRLKSAGCFENLKKITVVDEIRGERTFPENFIDAVILKSNGLPPYNFAHAVDDHLMHTTLVIRGEEWIASLAEHLEIFSALGFTAPRYAHLPVIQKIEDGKKRKISKRKDPEADMRYYLSQGFPTAAIAEYILTLANSNYELWREKNPALNYNEFPFSIKKVTSSSPLFDFAKLNDISKNVISRLTTDQIYEAVREWAKINDEKFFNTLLKKKTYALGVFNMERNVANPRKDIIRWGMVKNFYSYMFSSAFKVKISDFAASLKAEDIKGILAAYTSIFDDQDDKQVWFNKIKDLGPIFNFAREVKEYKKAPENYKGHCGDVSGIIRVAITGRQNTPDLYEICRILGKKEIIKRLNKVLKQI